MAGAIRYAAYLFLLVVGCLYLAPFSIKLYHYFLCRIEIRMHVVNEIRLIATDVVRSVVCMYVCLCVFWSHRCAVQKRPNQSIFRLGMTLMGPRNHVLDGPVEIPAGWGNFGECSAK